MPPAHLHVIGLSAGSVTGYCVLTVPRNSIFGYEKPDFINKRVGRFEGAEAHQAINIARLVRATQGLDFMVGPALAVEDSMSSEPDAEDLIQFRINSMLTLLKQQQQLGDAEITLNAWVAEYTEKQLKRLGLLYNKDYANDAVIQALTTLRQARADFEVAAELWPYRAGIDDEKWE